METITIPYEDYKDLLEQSSMLDALIHDISYIIEEADTTYNKEDIRIDDDFRMIAKKYCKNIYNIRLKELERELEKKERESENNG